jgi:hypothetical protein
MYMKNGLANERSISARQLILIGDLVKVYIPQRICCFHDGMSVS